MINLITQQDVNNEVPYKWGQQYRNGASDNQKQITLALNKLTEPLNKEEIDTIIGNTSWTRLECSICKKEVNTIVRIESDDFDGWEGEHASVCKQCTEKMFNLFK